MYSEERYHKLCKQVLKKHYNTFRDDIKDGFFYTTPTQAEKRLLEMIYNFKREMEELVPVSPRDNNMHLMKESILAEYVAIARKYGNRVKRKYGLV